MYSRAMLNSIILVFRICIIKLKELNFRSWIFAIPLVIYTVYHVLRRNETGDDGNIMQEIHILIYIVYVMNSSSLKFSTSQHEVHLGVISLLTSVHCPFGLTGFLFEYISCSVGHRLLESCQMRYRFCQEILYV